MTTSRQDLTAGSEARAVGPRGGAASITGGQPPGFVYELGEGDLEIIPGNSPHYIGLFETLSLGRGLGLDVATEIIIIAVEAVDCMTVGGDMNPMVERALPGVIDRVEALVGQ